MTCTKKLERLFGEVFERDRHKFYRIRRVNRLILTNILSSCIELKEYVSWYGSCYNSIRQRHLRRSFMSNIRFILLTILTGTFLAQASHDENQPIPADSNAPIKVCRGNSGVPMGDTFGQLTLETEKKARLSFRGWPGMPNNEPLIMGCETKRTTVCKVTYKAPGSKVKRVFTAHFTEDKLTASIYDGDKKISTFKCN